MTEILYHYVSIKTSSSNTQSGINSVKIDTLTMLDQVSVISSQKLKPTLLNPSYLKLFLTKLESQIVSHPWLVLPKWEGEKRKVHA